MKRNPANISINMLVVLDAMCRLKNTTRAAEEINISQPAISQYLKRLKELAGTDLFVRSTSGLEPTQSGLDLWEYAVSVLDTCEEISQFSEKDFDPYAFERKFTVAIPLLNTAFFLEHISIYALQEYPNVNINLINLPMEDAYEHLDMRDIDVYIGYKSSHMHKSLEYNKVLDVGLTVICSDKCSLYNKDSISKQDFIETPNIKVFTKFHDPVFDEVLAEKGLMQQKFIDVPDLEAVPHILKHTDSIFLATQMSADHFTSNYPHLKELKTDFKLPDMELYTVWSRVRSNSSPNIWLRNFVERQILENK